MRCGTGKARKPRTTFIIEILFNQRSNGWAGEVEDWVEDGSSMKSYWNVPIKRDIWFMNSNQVGDMGKGERHMGTDPLSVITIMIKCAAMRLFNLVL